MKISHYWAEDWEAFYIDGELYWQHHNLEAAELLYMLKEDDLLNKITDFYSCDIDFSSCLYEIGKFPKKEEDIMPLLKNKLIVKKYDIN